VHSSLIGKIEKARRYAQEPDRVSIGEIKASFRGENDEHHVAYREGSWKCSCEFFGGWNVCCHTMAMERLLGAMLPRTGSRESELLSAGAR
jgi:hypothetical protein